ncbi:lipocalin family protein [Paraburkholderia sp. A2WS-5]|uniref:lipocalin family protein n=1 Tax=unclassified Paraburkholderia TaxID=2615204 RepID=UPI003B81F20E
MSLLEMMIDIGQPARRAVIHSVLRRHVSALQAVAAAVIFLLAACATRTSGNTADAVPRETPPPALQSVPVELTRYMGRWYTIATVPYLGEREYVGSYADWELRKDGRINDNYFGRRHGFDQPVTGGTLVASVVPGSGGGKWRVTILWPFDMVVLTVYVDPDYRYTVRCEENGSPIWILSRTPDMDEDVYADLVRRLAAMGIRTDRLRRVPQHPEQIGQPGFMAPR